MNNDLRIVLILSRAIKIHGVGCYPAGAIIPHRPSTAGAFVAAVKNGYGRLDLMPAADVARREHVPHPELDGALLVGSVTSAKRDPGTDYEAKRRLFRLEAFSKLTEFERDEYRTILGIPGHKPLCPPGSPWPQSEDAQAQAILVRLDRYADKEIAILRERARRNHDAALAAEQELFALFEQEAQAKQAAAELAAHIAKDAAERFQTFAQSGIKPASELEQAASGKGPAANDARTQLAQLAQDERRRAVRAKVDSSIAAVENVSKTASEFGMAAKVEAARTLANEAIEKFRANDLDGAESAAVAAHEALVPNSITGSKAVRL